MSVRDIAGFSKSAHHLGACAHLWPSVYFRKIDYAKPKITTPSLPEKMFQVLPAQKTSVNL